MSEEFGDAFGDDEVQPTSDAHRHAEPEPELVYSSAVEFFSELLTQSYVREVNEGVASAWCPEWYKHPEALIRMESIWRAWKHLRLEPALGISTWWLNHADPLGAADGQHPANRAVLVHRPNHSGTQGHRRLGGAGSSAGRRMTGAGVP